MFKIKIYKYIIWIYTHKISNYTYSSVVLPDPSAPAISIDVPSRIPPPIATSNGNTPVGINA